MQFVGVIGRPSFLYTDSTWLKRFLGTQSNWWNTQQSWRAVPVLGVRSLLYKHILPCRRHQIVIRVPPVLDRTLHIPLYNNKIETLALNQLVRYLLSCSQWNLINLSTFSRRSQPGLDTLHASLVFLALTIACQPKLLHCVGLPVLVFEQKSWNRERRWLFCYLIWVAFHSDSHCCIVYTNSGNFI